MSSVVMHNLTAMNCQRQLNITTSLRAKSAEKLNSGYRINRAADDAAGLAISEKMRKQIRGLNRGSKNMQDAVSLCQVADGALTETHSMLHRMNELCIQSANGTNSTSDRRAIQNEIDELITEIDRVAKTTTFNEAVYPLYTPSSGSNSSAGQTGGGAHIQEVTHMVYGLQYGDEDWVQYGDLFVRTRGVRGVDFEYDATNRVFTLLSDKDIQITTKGVTTTNDRIFVKSGVSANVCLRDCKINMSGSQLTSAFKIADDSTGNVTVTILGDNVLTSGNGAAGIEKNGGVSTGTLTLQGSGVLRATGNGSATGGRTAAGIGGGYGQSGCNIKILSGTIIASSNGSTAAGIGGSGNRNWNKTAHGDGNNIEILGGNVEAYGGDDAAGIGGAYNGEGQNIRLGNSADVYVYAKADYGMRSISRYGPAIGAGYPNSGGITRRTASVYLNDVRYAGNIGIQGSLHEAGDNSYHDYTYGTRQTYTEEPEPMGWFPVTEYIDVVVDPSSGARSSASPHSVWIQMGAETMQGICMGLVDASASSLGVDSLNLMSAESATNSIDIVGAAIAKVSTYRSYFGAMQNRFEHGIKINDNTSKNLQYSESRIRDTDYASEMVNYATNNIIISAAESILAQANNTGKDVLYLLSMVF